MGTHDLHDFGQIGLSGARGNAQLFGNLFQGFVQQFIMDEYDPVFFGQSLSELHKDLQDLPVVEVGQGRRPISLVYLVAPELLYSPFLIGKMAVDGKTGHAGKIQRQCLYLQLVPLIPKVKEYILDYFFRVLSRG